MRRAGALAAVMTACLCAPAPASASHDADDHSANVRPVASVPMGGLGDIAFWGDRALVSQFVFDDGSTDGFSVVDISDPAAPREIKRFRCTGGGWDVSLWEDIAFLSVDSFTPSEDRGCDSAPGTGFMGIKIVSVEDPERPVGIGAVEMPCSGSHTNTVVPDVANRRVFVYASGLRYSTDAPAPACDAVIEVPLDDPASAKVVGSLGGDQVESCHDVGAFLPRKLLVAACANEMRMYDISEPASPKLLSTIVNPVVRGQHSGAFSNDGNTVVMGEEDAFYSGPTGACPGGTRSPVGALWFYDVTDPASPVPRGYYQLERGLEPRSPKGAGCSAHDFNVIPTRGEQDIVVTAWYAGGLSAVDFTDPSAPREIAHYQPALDDPLRRAHYWSAYWYRDFVYATNTFETERKSFDVYEISDPAIGPTFRLPFLNPQTQMPLADAPIAVAEPPERGAAAGGDPQAPPAPCRPAPKRVRVKGARRVLRATLHDGRRRVRRLPVRGATVRLHVRGLRPGRYLARFSYRDRGGRKRTAGRRVTVC